MNAIQALSLRKPDARNLGGIPSNASDAGSRFSKKSNIKEILVRNFFRKYPISGEVSDIEQLKIERQVAQEMDNFVNSNAQINSKNLNEFETRLASDVQLSKRPSNSRPSQSGSNGRNMLVPQTQPSVRRSMVSPQNQIRKGSQRHVALNRNKTTHIGEGKKFQLPSINSHAALGGANHSMDQPRSSLRAGADSYNRRSQVVTGNQQNSAYGGKALDSYGTKGLTKLRTHNNSNVQTSARLERRSGNVLQTQQPNAIDKSTPGKDMQASSGMRNLSLAAKGNREIGSNYPGSTKEQVLRAGGNSIMANLNQMMGQANLQADQANSAADPTRSTKMSNKKLRKLPDGVRTVEVEDVPSDISADEWGEIQKFGQRLHEEQVKKQKAQHEQRQKQVRQVLDQQVKLRAELREKTIKEKEDFDRKLIEAAQKEMEAERKQKQDLQQKVLEQKRMRDIMLKESKQKQVDEQLRRQVEEKERVQKLAADLEEERKTKDVRKQKEREAAMKVIKDNMQEKKKRNAELELVKRREAQQVEDNMRVALEKEKAREEEMAARGKRIQAVMDSMGEVIRDNEKEMQLKQEREYIKECIEKDEQARLQDINKKNKNRAKHMQLNEVLNQQINEKRMRAENDARANQSYMNRMVERANMDNRQRTEAEEARKRKMLDNQQFLKDQMTSSSGASVAVAPTGSDIKNRKKYALGGMMNPEEVRMNRALLQEIARVKRGEEPTGMLANQTNNPI